MTNSTWDMIRRERAGQSPFWRWTRAQDLQAGRSRRDQFDDSGTREAFDYLSDMAAAANGEGRLTQEEVLRRNPDLASAIAIYQRNDVDRWKLEAWLLTGLSFAEVAAKTALSPTVVYNYAAIFFDVASRLASRTWIFESWALGHKFHRPWPSSEYDYWRFAAYQFHAKSLELLIDDFTGKKRAEDESFPSADELRCIIRYVTAGAAGTGTDAARILSFLPRLAKTQYAVGDPRLLRTLELCEAANVNADVKVKSARKRNSR